MIFIKMKKKICIATNQIKIRHYESIHLVYEPITKHCSPIAHFEKPQRFLLVSLKKIKIKK